MNLKPQSIGWFFYSLDKFCTTKQCKYFSATRTHDRYGALTFDIEECTEIDPPELNIVRDFEISVEDANQQLLMLMHFYVKPDSKNKIIFFELFDPATLAWLSASDANIDCTLKRISCHRKCPQNLSDALELLELMIVWNEKHQRFSIPMKANGGIPNDFENDDDCHFSTSNDDRNATSLLDDIL